MATWQEAKSLVTLLDQINHLWPNRSKLSDGELGDARHQAETSDHNPNSHGVVTALDVTNDPANGLVSRHLAETLLASRDNRIKYVISNRQICAGKDGPSPWKWRPYHGANPHEHHCHISVSVNPTEYDDPRQWNLSGVNTAPQPQLVVPVVVGDSRWLQAQLNSHGANPRLQEDGHEGALTQAAIRAYAVEQLKKG